MFQKKPNANNAESLTAEARKSPRSGIEALEVDSANEIWSRARWDKVERETRERALAAPSDEKAWEVLVKQARAVLRTYSDSFYIVTRFLPAVKRAQVEAIYAVVRYPDEIVDTFPITQTHRAEMLDDWEMRYNQALRARSVRESLKSGAPCFVAGFADVVRKTGIPQEHYRSFLDAMRLDVWPRRFETLDDLIDSYIYGSAIVVGFFLTYVYGSPTPRDFDRALRSARHLGIALQLTNFLRDVAEDQRRGRVYLPQDMLRREGVVDFDAGDLDQRPALNRVLLRLTEITEEFYSSSLADLDAFNADSRVAIRACVDVYRQLNRRIASNPRGILHRESVPMREKFRALPVSKYWRLPLAYFRP
ncbi:MAG TPA: phytoene/squalene synthase family protein [Blastocatellia bacterium]|nr:phytoene/squalene synthase family protein [Blastocatellia bacterium]